jgi:hypothetical protein
MKRLALAMALATVAAPAAASSLLDYGWGQADAHVPVGSDHFNIWVEKSRPTFLIEPSVKTAFSGGGHYPDPTWRTVAEAFVQPIGCGISDIRPLSRAGAAWEATYVCPDKVDLRQLAKAQRRDLLLGLPLHQVQPQTSPRSDP